MKKLVLRLLLAFAVGLGVNALLGFFWGGRDLPALLGKNPLYLAGIGLGAYLLGMYGIETLRLSRVLKAYGYDGLSWVERFQNSIMGYFFSSVTPMAAGGQPFQILHLKTRGVPSSLAANVYINRYVQHLGFSMVVVLAGYPFTINLLTRMQDGGGTGFLAAGLILSMTLSLLMIIALLRPGFSARLFEWLGSFILPKRAWGRKAAAWVRNVDASIAHAWSRHVPLMLADTLLGIANTVLQAVSLWATLALTGLGLSLPDVVSAYMILNLLVFYIPTPGAAGGIEGIYSLAFGVLSGDMYSAWAGVLLWRIGTFYLMLPIGFFLLVATKPMRSFLTGADKTDG